MPYGTRRLILAPAMLTVALTAVACGSSSPTAPQPQAAELGGGHYTLALYGTSSCSSTGANGDILPAASIDVTLEPGGAPGVWRLFVPGETLVGEVDFIGEAVEGYLRGSAVTSSVRVSTGPMPDETVAFQGVQETGRYSGIVLVGTPRFEGLGAASGDVTTCQANGFTLTPQ